MGYWSFFRSIRVIRNYKFFEAMRLSLRSKILILLVTVSLVPLALLAVLGIYLVNITQRYSISQLETQLLRQKEKEIEKFFMDALTLIHPQVAYPVAALSGVPADQRERILRGITETNKFIQEISFLEYDTSYPDKPEIGLELAKIAGGAIVADLVSQRDAVKFKKAISGKDYLGPVYRKGDNYFMTIAAPVQNSDRVIIGVITAEVSLSPVARIISDGALGNSGYLILTDDKGEIWAKPNNLNYRDFGSNLYVLSVMGGYQGAGLDAQDEYPSSFGGNVIASGKRIKDLNWVMIAEWPKEDAYSAVYSLIKQAAIFFILILGVAILAAYFFGRRILKPIIVLEKGARIIGDGNLDHRININTKDELEELAGYFNEMAKNLKGIEALREAKARMEGLARSLEKEKELSQIKDKFISTASHQLRTPISVIRWTAEELKNLKLSGPDGDMAKDQFKMIYKNSELLAMVIGDILMVAELGIGYRPSAPSEFSLKETVKEVADEFGKDAMAKAITVKLNIPESDCRVKGSKLNIKRALDNLIGNAITYTREKGEIEIGLSLKDDQIIFSIKDNGIGIPPEDQPLIFGEFFRARNAIEMKNVGTGLGLFIVKTIIEGHKGKVGLESSPAGSRFWFSLPAWI